MFGKGKCKHCDGKGTQFGHPCPYCHGTGKYDCPCPPQPPQR